MHGTSHDGAHPTIAARSGRATIVRRLTARPDAIDFRDQMFAATLVQVPPARPLSAYRRHRLPVLDQGTEGACTGFALAAVVNYLASRLEPRAKSAKTANWRRHASPRMLYDLARRYDEWPGEEYDGSSARGAMKGWHKHGVCAHGLWANDPPGGVKPTRRDDPWHDALQRPLGAYYRVNHRDLVAMHSAITEVGILYATAMVHEGWRRVPANGRIAPAGRVLGGHAFAIVGYDANGFWLQNSWGDDWGDGGFAHIGYADWLENGTDAWVARMGVPVATGAVDESIASTGRAGHALAHDQLRPHIISVGNEGLPRPNGGYGTRAEDITALFATNGAFDRATTQWTGRKHLLLYAHGGLVDESSAVQRVADYRAAMMPQQVYPVAFIWKTDYWTTVRNILRDAFSRRRSEGIIDSAKDFLLDRLDDALEPLARSLSGKAVWSEMKENARRAALSAEERKRFTDPQAETVDGASYVAAHAVAQLCARDPDVIVHIVAHSAGSIFMAPLIAKLRSAFLEAGVTRSPVATCTLWAPACTVATFEEDYRPFLETGAIDELALYTLTDDAERDDHCARIYNKSLLYLVSNAFESKPRIPLFRDGEPILGMARFAAKSQVFSAPAAKVSWVQAPNHAPVGDLLASHATSHGAFDDDAATVAGTLRRVVAAGRAATRAGAKAAAQASLAHGAPRFERSAASRRDRRQELNELSG